MYVASWSAVMAAFQYRKAVDGEVAPVPNMLETRDIDSILPLLLPQRYTAILRTSGLLFSNGWM